MGSAHFLMSISHVRKKQVVPACLVTVWSSYILLGLLLLARSQVYVSWITFYCTKTEHIRQHISINIYLTADRNLNQLSFSSFQSLKCSLAEIDMNFKQILKITSGCDFWIAKCEFLHQKDACKPCGHLAQVQKGPSKSTWIMDINC